MNESFVTRHSRAFCCFTLSHATYFHYKHANTLNTLLRSVSTVNRQLWLFFMETNAQTTLIIINRNNSFNWNTSLFGFFSTSVKPHAVLFVLGSWQQDGLVQLGDCVRSQYSSSRQTSSSLSSAGHCWWDGSEHWRRCCCQGPHWLPRRCLQGRPTSVANEWINVLLASIKNNRPLHPHAFTLSSEAAASTPDPPIDTFPSTLIETRKAANKERQKTRPLKKYDSVLVSDAEEYDEFTGEKTFSKIQKWQQYEF